MQAYSDFISGIVAALLIFIALFFIFRHVVCWYWKINERVKLLEDIKMLLQDIRDFQNADELNEVLVDFHRENNPTSYEKL